MAEYFFNKIQTIDGSFDSNESDLSPLAENLSVERDKPYLVTFPLMEYDTLQSIFLAIKSGSPCDPAPPKILKQVIGIVSPVICELINLSISSGTVPPLWKNAMVKALLKKPSLDPDNLANYRPISLLPEISKILEKHVNFILSAFLESNKLLHPSQAGFRPGHGTETALLAVMEKSRRIIDTGGSAAVIMLDLSAAFDTVNHSLLVERLRKMGISGTALTWIKSFLDGRTFQVFESEAISKSWPLHCGVPQGSSLSPTLFNAYMAPLADIVSSYGVDIVTYADDTQLVVSLNHSDTTSSCLSTCLGEVAKWMAQSHLKLNGDKTELMILGNPSLFRADLMWPLSMGQAPIPKPEMKSLGFWLDSNLNLKVQVRKVVASCFGILKMLRKIIPLLPFQAKKLLTQALVLSRLDYGNALYFGSPGPVLSKLQVIQNCAARILMGTQNRQSAKPALKALHWLPIQERVRFKALCITHRLYRGRGPAIISSLVKSYQANRPLRSDGQCLIEVPRIRKARSGGRLFSYNAARLWNSLPLFLRKETNHLTFRRLLNTYLFPG